MRGPIRALMGGFSVTTSSLDLEGRLVWPPNSTLDLNQTRPGWVSPEISVAAFGGDFENLTEREKDSGVTSAALKEKNWPALLILVIIALTIGGNILVILAVSLEKKLQNATNFFLRSLAVADMLVGILVMPISLINILYDYVWPLPLSLCPLWIYLDVLFSTASIMHLCAISLDRYVAIRNPIEHSRFNSRTKAMLKIAAVWTISIGVSMPIPVIGLHNEDKVFVNGSCVLNEERFMLIGSFVAFFIPLVIMVVTYCLTIQVLQRQATVFLSETRSSSQQPLHPPPSFSIPQIHTLAPPEDLKPVPQSRRNTLGCLRGAEGSSMVRSVSAADSISVLPSSEAASQLSSPAVGHQRGSHSEGLSSPAAGGNQRGSHSEGASSGRKGMMQAIKNEKRASKVLGIVFFLFLIMWCPFFITNVTSVLCRDSCDESLLHDLLNVFVWVGYISSGVNPLVYTLFNKTYRQAFSSYIRCQYANSAANSAAARTLLTPAPCASHSVTPLLVAAKSGIDRNSNCRNGRKNGRFLAVDPEDTTDDGFGNVSVSLSVSDCQNVGVVMETDTTEPELSIISYTSPASRELTSAV